MFLISILLCSQRLQETAVFSFSISATQCQKVDLQTLIFTFSLCAVSVWPKTDRICMFCCTFWPVDEKQASPAHFNNTMIILITVIILVTIIVIRNFHTVTSLVGSQRRLWERDIIRGRKLYGASNNLVQELQLDDARFHITPCAPKLIRSVYRLSSPFFLLFLLLWKRLSTRLSLVSCQKGTWRRAFFFRKVQLFSTWKDALSCRKRRRRWHFKKHSGLIWKHGLLHRIVM